MIVSLDGNETYWNVSLGTSNNKDSSSPQLGFTEIFLGGLRLIVTEELDGPMNIDGFQGSFSKVRRSISSSLQTFLSVDF